MKIVKIDSYDEDDLFYYLQKKINTTPIQKQAKETKQIKNTNFLKFSKDYSTDFGDF